MEWLMKVIYVLVILTVSLTAGCQDPNTINKTLAVGPGVDDMVPSNIYAPRTVEATGGYPVWIKTKKIEFDCVVTFYNPDNTFYLTEQHYELFPWSHAVRVSALEPQGNLSWLLIAETFNVESEPPSKALPYDIHNTVYSVREIALAPIRLLDKSTDFSKDVNPVKMEGLWYYPVEQYQRTDDSKSCWTKKVFYMNKENCIVDIIFLADEKNNKFFSVRGYDYKQIEEDSVYMPTRIEIFKTDSNGIRLQQLVKIAVNNL